MAGGHPHRLLAAGQGAVGVDHVGLAGEEAHALNLAASRGEPVTERDEARASSHDGDEQAGDRRARGDARVVGEVEAADRRRARRAAPASAIIGQAGASASAPQPRARRAPRRRAGCRALHSDEHREREQRQQQRVDGDGRRAERARAARGQSERRAAVMTGSAARVSSNSDERHASEQVGAHVPSTSPNSSPSTPQGHVRREREQGAVRRTAS